MGKVKPDLAGAYVSKVGGVAYYIKDGVNYVRSLSKSGYKSNTPLQAGVKARFKSASQMAGQMKEIAKVGFPQRKRGLTPKKATAIRMMLCMCCFWIPNSCLRVWCQ